MTTKHYSELNAQNDYLQYFENCHILFLQEIKCLFQGNFHDLISWEELGNDKDDYIDLLRSIYEKGCRNAGFQHYYNKVGKRTLSYFSTSARHITFNDIADLVNICF